MSARDLGRRCLLATALVLVARPSAAAPAQAPELLTAVPETPALAYLGATPAKVLRPGAVRDFAIALLSGTGDSGTAKHGFAVEATPWFLVPGWAIDGSRYRESRLAYVLANAQLSIGTARAEDEGGDTDLALGLKLTLADAGDPLRSEEFRRALADALLGCAPAQPDPTPSEACAGRETEQAWEAWTAERWNAARLAVATAWGLRLRDSELDEREYAGWKGWVVGALPLGRRGQLITQLAREYRRQVGDGPRSVDWSVGIRALGGGPRINGFVELLAESRDAELEPNIDPENGPPLDGDDESGVWSVGVEARVAESLWASAGFGSRFSALVEAAEKTFVLIGLRWGISSEARFTALRGAAD